MLRVPPMSSTHRRRYTDPAWLEREHEQIWPRAWVCAAHEAELPAPGAVLAVDVGLSSVILVRGDDGAVRAFLNVCPHRGTRVVSGRACEVRQLRCGVHGWQWRLDGRVAGIPSREQFAHLADLDERASLRPVALARWGEFFWVNLDPQPEPFDDFVGPFRDALAPWNLSGFRVSNVDTVEMPANWKLAVGIFIEGYHIPVVHPQFAGVVDIATERREFHGDHSWASALLYPPGGFGTGASMSRDLRAFIAAAGVDPEPFRARPADARAAVREGMLRARALGELTPESLSDDGLVTFANLFLFPNVMFSLFAHLAVVQRFRPHPRDPAVSYMDQYVLERRRLDEAPRTLTHRVIRVGVDSLGDNSDQDVALLGALQQGQYGVGPSSQTLGLPDERLARFEQSVDAALDGPGRDVGGAPVRHP